MSIRPVDFNGMIQNTPEAQNQNNQVREQPQVQQQNIAVVFERETQEAETRVNERSDTAESGPQINADAGGNNGQGYEPGKKKEKKKHEVLPDGSVTVKNPHGSFDIKI
ncbi:MAG: hypothetical protein VZQ80_00285 [Lachnospiraceae bacterium]|nr:hypothetical protein [Lachnospiraceae bacterium]